MITIKRLTMMFMGLTLMDIAVLAAEPAPVFIVAGQSNTDGRVPMSDFPKDITQESYQHCLWSYGSGTNAADGSYHMEAGCRCGQRHGTRHDSRHRPQFARMRDVVVQEQCPEFG